MPTRERGRAAPHSSRLNPAHDGHAQCIKTSAPRGADLLPSVVAAHQSNIRSPTVFKEPTGARLQTAWMLLLGWLVKSARIFGQASDTNVQNGQWAGVLHCQPLDLLGSPTWARTRDLRINSPRGCAFLRRRATPHAR